MSAIPAPVTLAAAHSAQADGTGDAETGEHLGAETLRAAFGHGERGERADQDHHHEPDDALGEDHVARVVRVEGQVVSEKDTFGEIRIESDNGVEHVVSLDVELNRRGVEVPLGATLRATGPVLYSYGSYSVIIMRVGQLEIIPNE